MNDELHELQAKMDPKLCLQNEQFFQDISKRIQNHDFKRWESRDLVDLHIGIYCR